MSRRVELLLDSCNALSDNGTWTILNADVTNLATTTRGIAGAAAIEFDKTDGADNATAAGVYKVLTKAINFGQQFISPSNAIVWHCYLSSKADVASAFIRLGNSAANYYEYQIDDSALVAGYNRCAVQLSKIATFAGTFVDWTAVDYIAVGLNMAAQDDALADIAIDDISISPVEVEANVSVSSGSVTVNNKITAETGVPADIADGDQGDAWHDGKGRQVIKGYIMTSDSLGITPVADSPRAAFQDAKSALTAAGSTASVNLPGKSCVECQVVIASLEANQFVGFQLESSADDASWDNVDAEGLETFAIADGTITLRAYGLTSSFYRLTMTTDSVGGAVTLTSTFSAGR